DAVHAVLPQVPLGGGLGDGLLAQLLQLDLVEADRRGDVEGGGAGVLADGGAGALWHGDVLGSAGQVEGGLAAGLVGGTVGLGHLGNVGRQKGAGAADQFEDVGVEARGVHGVVPAAFE